MYAIIISYVCAYMYKGYYTKGPAYYIFIFTHYAVLLKFTYYAQFYAQEQEFLSDYYAIYIQFCMSNSLHVADNFYRLFY